MHTHLYRLVYLVKLTLKNRGQRTFYFDTRTQADDFVSKTQTHPAIYSVYSTFVISYCDVDYALEILECELPELLGLGEI